MTLDTKRICIFCDHDVRGGIMSDLPSGAARQPNMWGMFVFQKE